MALPDQDKDEDGLTENERIHAEAMTRFDLCESADAENRENARDDIRFVKMRDQWPENIRKEREEQGRPCLTLDQLGAVVRQVVNDSRLNKPQIKVKPVDSDSDPETAEVIGGVIRNIEYTSNADVAYDTAIDYAVCSGRGYFRINAEYASDDTFDQDLVIDRINDPLSVYPDPYSTAADSSDWRFCFVLETVDKGEYESRYGDDFTAWDTLSMLGNSWFDNDRAVIAEYWRREPSTAYALMLSNGEVVKSEAPVEIGAVHFDGIPVPPEVIEAAMMAGQPVESEWLVEPITVQAIRPIKSWKVYQHILSGSDVLDTIEWPGIYIPVVPVYGDDFVLWGQRHFVSLIRPAKDAQRMKNYWRSSTTELVALAPKAPFVGPESAFTGEDADKWETANSENHAFLSYKGNVAPQRQPFAGVPAGALQEALNASDDIKSITGIYDASLGARSNETSGVAINARQREGDVSTYHFIDNLARAIRHAGRIIVDLIPSFYSTERVLRTLGMDGKSEMVQVGSPEAAEKSRREAEFDQSVQRIFALGVGKYDVVVEAGPSFSTQREEAVAAITELIRAAPQYADILGPMLLKNMDFPGVDEILDEIKQRMEQQAQAAAQGEQPDPKAMADLQVKMQEMQLKQAEAMANAELEREKLALDAFKAETDRMKVQLDASQPRPAPRTYA